MTTQVYIPFEINQPGMECIAFMIRDETDLDSHEQVYIKETKDTQVSLKKGNENNPVFMAAAKKLFAARKGL